MTTKTKIGLLPFTLAIIAWLSAGCAYMASTTETYQTCGTNSVPQLAGKTTMRGYSLFDANIALTKARNQSAMSGPTNSPYAPGTYMSGLNESATTTNLISIIQAVAAGVVQGMK